MCDACGLPNVCDYLAITQYGTQALASNSQSFLNHQDPAWQPEVSGSELSMRTYTPPPAFSCLDVHSTSRLQYLAPPNVQSCDKQLQQQQRSATLEHCGPVQRSDQFRSSHQFMSARPSHSHHRTFSTQDFLHQSSIHLQRLKMIQACNAPVQSSTVQPGSSSCTPAPSLVDSMVGLPQAWDVSVLQAKGEVANRNIFVAPECYLASPMHSVHKEQFAAGSARVQLSTTNCLHQLPLSPCTPHCLSTGAPLLPLVQNKLDLPPHL
eukprot:gene1500-2806_t